MIETWKTIKHYENKYKISNTGRVKSIGRIKNSGRAKNGSFYKEKILKIHINNDGYGSVGLCKDGIVNRVRVHRLVALAFLVNKNNLPEVNHIDSNRLNNNLSNLEWVTHSKNLSHAIKYGNRKIPPSKKGVYDKNGHSKPLIQLTMDGMFLNKWLSAKDAERKLGLNAANIRDCANGRNRHAYNYLWKFECNYNK